MTFPNVITRVNKKRLHFNLTAPICIEANFCSSQRSLHFLTTYWKEFAQNVGAPNGETNCEFTLTENSARCGNQTQMVHFRLKGSVFCLLFSLCILVDNIYQSALLFFTGLKYHTQNHCRKQAELTNFQAKEKSREQLIGQSQKIHACSSHDAAMLKGKSEGIWVHHVQWLISNN